MNDYISIFEKESEHAGNALRRFCDAYPYAALFGISLCGSVLTLAASYLIDNGPAIVHEAMRCIHEFAG